MKFRVDRVTCMDQWYTEDESEVNYIRSYCEPSFYHALVKVFLLFVIFTFVLIATAVLSQPPAKKSKASTNDNSSSPGDSTNKVLIDKFLSRYIHRVCTWNDIKALFELMDAKEESYGKKLSESQNEAMEVLFGLGEMAKENKPIANLMRNKQDILVKSVVFNNVPSLEQLAFEALIKDLRAAVKPNEKSNERSDEKSNERSDEKSNEEPHLTEFISLLRDANIGEIKEWIRKEYPDVYRQLFRLRVLFINAETYYCKDNDMLARLYEFISGVVRLNKDKQVALFSLFF